jgi:hypothetical protein
MPMPIGKTTNHRYSGGAKACSIKKANIVSAKLGRIIQAEKVIDSYFAKSSIIEKYSKNIDFKAIKAKKDTKNTAKNRLFGKNKYL